MIKCEKCGNEIPDNSKFCPECGNELQEDQIEDNTNKVTPFGIVGLILGLIGMYFGNYGYMQFFTLVVPALCFSIAGMADKRHRKHGIAIAGLVVSIIAAVFSFFPPFRFR